MLPRSVCSKEHCLWLPVSSCISVLELELMCSFCRRKHGLDMTSGAVRELELMHLVGGDLAIEQPRPLPPKVKLIGPLMPAPAQPLPVELEVSKHALRSISALHSPPMSARPGMSQRY